LIIKEVAETTQPIVISTRNEPKAILMGYNAYLQQQILSKKGKEHRFEELVTKAQNLLEAAIEGYRDGDPKLYMFWSHFGRLMEKIWELTDDNSNTRPHSAISFQLYELSESCLAGHDQLSRNQLEPITKVLALLKRNDLSIEDAAEADRYLLNNQIDATFPLNLGSDFAALYDFDEDEEVEIFIDDD
ncbi:MAG: type II toxin-antitoxin system prevent-host-death family antitoxin, partial [Chloroflexota bacterium]